MELVMAISEICSFVLAKYQQLTGFLKSRSFTHSKSPHPVLPPRSRERSPAPPLPAPRTPRRRLHGYRSQRDTFPPTMPHRDGYLCRCCRLPHLPSLSRHPAAALGQALLLLRFALLSFLCSPWLRIPASPTSASPRCSAWPSQISSFVCCACHLWRTSSETTNKRCKC